jgi:hypothetical protein
LVWLKYASVVKVWVDEALTAVRQHRRMGPRAQHVMRFRINVSLLPQSSTHFTRERSFKGRWPILSCSFAKGWLYPELVIDCPARTDFIGLLLETGDVAQNPSLSVIAI